jgi:hypothetical protein
MKARNIRASLSALTAVVALGGLSCLPALSPVAFSDSRTSPQPWPTLKPDLTIESVMPYYTRNGVELWAKIANKGQIGVSNYGMKFEWGQGFGDQQQFFWFMASLQPGQTRWVKLDSSVYDLPVADQQYRLTIDHTHSISESNENNNTVEGP